MIVRRVIVTGGREWADSMWIESDLRALQGLGLHRVAQGAARGADRIVEYVWRIIAENYDAEKSEGRYAVDEQIDGPWPAAGNVRNRRMIDAEAELARLADEPLLGLAYPDPNSSGTWNCVEDMLRSGIPVCVATPDDGRRARVATIAASHGAFWIGNPALITIVPRNVTYPDAFENLGHVHRALLATAGGPTP